MARQFEHYSVRFTRDVTETQEVTVAVAAGLDAATAQAVARQLAPGRLKDTRWEPTTVGDAEEAAVARVEG
jgi:predicted PP-loop superfamily ATPase